MARSLLGVAGVVAAVTWWGATKHDPLAPVAPPPAPGILCDDLSCNPRSRATSGNQPVLELLSFRCTRDRGWFEVEGEVRNESGTPLDGIVAVATQRTAKGELVKSEDALVDYQPIMPGQASPFKVTSRGNPLSKKCEVAFKRFWGGEVRWTKK